MRKILFDSDVLLDVLAQREPFFTDSAKALNLATFSNIQGYVAGHAVTNIFYILRRQVGNLNARELIIKLLQHLQVVSVTDVVIRSALENPMTDFEDAVTTEAALTIEIEIIVTRNLSDFRQSTVRAISPTELLTLF